MSLQCAFLKEVGEITGSYTNTSLCCTYSCSLWGHLWLMLQKKKKLKCWPKLHNLGLTYMLLYVAPYGFNIYVISLISLWVSGGRGLSDVASKNADLTEDILTLKKWFAVHLKFKFHWVSCVLSATLVKKQVMLNSFISNMPGWVVDAWRDLI